MCSSLKSTPARLVRVEHGRRSTRTAWTWALCNSSGLSTTASASEALSRPFSFTSASPGDGGGAQYWTAHSMIPSIVRRFECWRTSSRSCIKYCQRYYRMCPELSYTRSLEQSCRRAGALGGLVISCYSRGQAGDMFWRCIIVLQKLLRWCWMSDWYDCVKIEPHVTRHGPSV